MCTNKSAMRRIGAITVMALTIGPPAWAVNFNIDFGNGVGVFGPPPAGYGAAAGNPPGAIGVWNNVPGPAPFPLVNLDGLPTLAQVAVIGAVNGVAGSCKIGSAKKLLDDYLGFPAGVIATIGPLPAGTYSVYTYAWAPTLPFAVTRVTIGGVGVNVGGPCGFPFGISPVNFASHVVVVPPGGFINIQLTTMFGVGRLNGIQIRD